jgi:hypothetical protein
MTTEGIPITRRGSAVRSSRITGRRKLAEQADDRVLKPEIERNDLNPEIRVN